MVEDQCPEWECKVRLFFLLKRNGRSRGRDRKPNFVGGGEGVRGRGRDRKPNFVAFSA